MNNVPQWESLIIDLEKKSLRQMFENTQVQYVLWEGIYSFKVKQMHIYTYKLLLRQAFNLLSKYKSAANTFNNSIWFI